MGRDGDMNKTSQKILQYMQLHPRWHHTLDLCEKLSVSLSTIHIRLTDLEDDGYVESRWDPDPPPPERGGYRRRQYRATGKRVEELPSDLVPA